MSPLLALVSSLCWGLADFTGGLATKRVGSLRVISVTYPVGFVLLTVLAITIVPGTISPAAIGWSIFVGVFGLAAMFPLYGALALGPMGIVSPLTALGGALVPVVVGIVRGETVTALTVGGMILAIAAVILVSREPGPHRRVTPRALLLSAAAGLLIGTYLTGIGVAPDDSGIWVATLGRGVGSLLLCVVAVVLLARKGTSSWRPFPWKLAVITGMVDALANGLFQLAAQQGELVVVAVIGCLYPAATLLLAHWVLKERMTRIQGAGVVLALGAAIALSI
ncbi:MAG: DMT family transporter [Actinomycetales bacterium]|nr:DMT family transporter [Actinomycetales bacterium]